MQDFFYSWIIAFSFFTVLPLPMVEWTDRRLRYLPRLMPVVGLFLGVCGYFLFILLQASTCNVFSKGVVMAFAYLVLSGGLHMDGLMDMSDAYFSRANKEKKLEIMKDPRIGAFGVMGFVSILLLKITVLTELFSSSKTVAILLLVIPVLSRIFQASMLCSFPYAKADGLAATFKIGAGRDTQMILGTYFILVLSVIVYLAGFKGLLIPVVLLLFSTLYYFWAKKNFGGITGDIVGGFVELAELLMIGVLLFI